jgi:putative nucleotidyltransferase with HDIG domain
MDDSRSTILVADDEESLREICLEALQDAGYRVLEASNGQDALDVLHASNVDLVLSDMRMPVLDGMQLLERIVQEKLDVDFLVMTGFGTIETAVETMKKGALDYLPKPFDISHLMLKVNKALEQRRQREERRNLNNLVRVLKLSKDLNNQLELSTLLNEFIFHLERNFSPKSAGVFLKKNGEGDLQLVRTRGKLLRSDPHVIGCVRRICQTVLTKQSSKLIDPYIIHGDPDFDYLLQEQSFPYSIMAAPMYNKDQPIGVVLLLRQDSQEMYTPEALQLLTVFASQTASAIENARLYGQMREMNNEIIRSFAQAVEAKDIYTRGHSDQVAYYATKLGRKLKLSKLELDHLYLAGIVHDIGKIGVPDHILNKPSHLTDDEYAIMKKHPEVGINILNQVGSLQDILPIIYHHHERIDGTGYPDGLSGEQIPFLAKVISVVDAFEAMSSDRAYRKALPVAKVKDILADGAGQQWEKDLVAAWMEIVDSEQLPSL